MWVWLDTRSLTVVVGNARSRSDFGTPLLRKHRSHLRSSDPDAWVFPSEALKTPMTRDNLWRRNIRPRIEKLGLEWATFQVMRRTHSTLSRKAGIDPKLVADQLGHEIGLNLDIYTVAGLDQRLRPVKALKSTLIQ